MNRTIEDQGAWDAVVARDASRADEFVYAVRTTGVYCRPGCPARRPLRKNVRFLPSAAAARAEGFRACRRCRPDDAFLAGAPAFLIAALERIERDPSAMPSSPELAAEAGMSPSHFAKRFKQETGWTPTELTTAMRVARFRSAGRRGAGVAAAGYEAGFGSSRGLYDAARHGLGMTPAAAARGGEGVALAVSLSATRFGRVLLATTEIGVAAVLLGDRDADLETELSRAFAAATRAAPDARHRAWRREMLAHLEGTRVPLALPLDLRGTPFQLKVWRALLEIPPGTTRSYGDVARSIGHRDAARAVARACASNVVAVLVPCHRVVRADGGRGGYRWGAKRKAALLEREGASPPD